MKETASDHAIQEDTEKLPPGPAAVKFKGEKSEYKKFLSKAVKEIYKAGFDLPAIKNAQGAKGSFQFKGHAQTWDNLRGYWERNSKTYTHMAKVHYRALYLGTILMLAEEELKSGLNHKDLIAKLQVWCEENKPKHKLLMIMQTLRREVRQLVEEREEDLISEQEFYDSCLEMVKTFDKKEDQIKFSIMVDRMVDQENVKVLNNKCQQKHRRLEKEAKGIYEVE